MKQYRKRQGTEIVAVQFDFDSDGFEYRKWDDVQTCKPGDWIVFNDGETYTVDQDSFSATYEKVSAGQYKKSGTIWARVATKGGKISTKEGTTGYRKGDYVVCNDCGGDDCYAISASKFESMYEEVTE